MFGFKTRNYSGHSFQVGYSPPPRGGVAAPVRRCCEASEAAQTGWSLTSHPSKTNCETLSVSDHPVRSINVPSRLLPDCRVHLSSVSRGLSRIQNYFNKTKTYTLV